MACFGSSSFQGRVWNGFLTIQQKQSITVLHLSEGDSLPSKETLNSICK
ncbi:hypothetical protein NXF25_021442 [Crotalus adamanteus]|uniref:Uncharacterized protein n=1 Tax=Crotalus adamanteus TaxID=8729 RepID=A0AAW1B8H0_CROAD